MSFSTVVAELSDKLKPTLEKAALNDSEIVEKIADGKFNPPILEPFFATSPEFGKIQREDLDQCKATFQRTKEKVDALTTALAAKKGQNKKAANAELEEAVEEFKTAQEAIASIVEASLNLREEMVKKSSPAAAGTSSSGKSAAGSKSAASLSSAAATPSKSASTTTPTHTTARFSQVGGTNDASLSKLAAGGAIYDTLAGDPDLFKKHLQAMGPAAVRLNVFLYLAYANAKILAPEISDLVSMLSDPKAPSLHLDPEQLLHTVLLCQQLLALLSAELDTEKQIANQQGSASRWKLELQMLLARIGDPAANGLRIFADGGASSTDMAHRRTVATFVETIQAFSASKEGDKKNPASGSGDKVENSTKDKQPRQTKMPPLGCLACGAEDHWPSSKKCPKYGQFPGEQQDRHMQKRQRSRSRSPPRGSKHAYYGKGRR